MKEIHYPRSTKVSIVGLWVAAFPTIGLQRTDASGMEGLAITSPTFILQGIWTALCCLMLLIVTLYSQPIWHSRKSVFSLTIVLLCLASTAISILVNNPFDIYSWLRTIQYFSSVLLGVVATCILAKNHGLIFVGSTAISTIRYYFLFSLAAILALYLWDPELSFPSGSGSRGPRLGGSAIHPNTLALAAVLFLCTNSATTGVGKMWKLFSSLLAIAVIALTGSSGGLLLLTMWALINSFGRFKIARVIYVSFLLVFFYGCLFLFPLMLWNGLDAELLSNLPGTWGDRLLIYQAAADGIRVNPLFGVGSFEGVQNFFLINSPTEYFTPPHSHNYVFDTLLSRGIVGGIPYLFLGAYGAYLSASYLYKISSKSSIGYTMAMIFFTIFIQGLMESSVAGIVKPFAHVYLFTALTLMILLKGQWQSQVSPNSLTLRSAI